MNIGSYINQRRKELGLTLEDIGKAVGVGKSTVKKWENGDIANMKRDKIALLARVLQTSPIAFVDSDVESNHFPAPDIADKTVTFPIIGDMAAGFEHIAAENWSGDTICIPENYLHGRPASDYIVLNVCGDSMYPFYLDGDKVLVLRTPALEYSGQVALVRYDGEMATLKKVEYHPGDDKMKLIPANPLYQPREITGSDLDQCSIIGIPKLVIREV